MQNEIRDASSYEEFTVRSLWLIHLYRTLWKIIVALGTTGILWGVMASIIATWFTSSNGIFLPDAPIGRLLTTWPIALPTGGFLVFLALWIREMSHRPTSEWIPRQHR